MARASIAYVILYASVAAYAIAAPIIGILVRADGRRSDPAPSTEHRRARSVDHPPSTSRQRRRFEGASRARLATSRIA